jgi:hypothetical protein
MNISREELSRLNRINRELRLEREKMEGKPRAKSFGGKPSNRATRRQSKAELRHAH